MQLSALRHPEVRNLSIAQAVATLGDRLFHMTIVWLLLSAGSIWLAAIVAATAAAPSFVTALSGPRLVDRAADLRILALILTTCAAAVVGLAVWGTDPLPMVGALGVGLMIGVNAAVGRPNIQALIPSLVSREAAGPVVALLDLVDRVALVAGPGLAALLLSFLTRSQLLLVNAALYVLSALALLVVRHRLAGRRVGPGSGADAPAAVAEEVEPGAVADAVRWTPFRLHPDLRFAVATRAVSALVWPTVTLGIPLLIVNGFGGAVGGYGAVLCAFSGASIVGNLVASRMPVRALWRVCGLAWGIAGLLFVLLSIVTSLPWLVVYGVIGLVVPAGVVSTDMSVARRLEERHRAEVFAAQRGAIDTANLVGLLIAPILLLWGPRAAIALAGAGMAVIVALVVGRWRYVVASTATAVPVMQAVLADAADTSDQLTVAA